MTRTAGMSTTMASTLAARRAAAGTRDLIEAAATRPTDGDSGGITVALTDIADHPHNPREELGDLTDITATLPTLGLLQTPIVARRDAFLSVYPHHADLIGRCTYVALIGHRRLAACRAVGWADVKVRVDDTLVDTDRLDLEAMFAENVSRRALTPIEEARALQEMVAIGRTQRQIEARLGISQSQVAKRLALLQLIPELQLLVIGGQVPHYGGGPIPLTEAVEYARLDPDDQAAAWAIATERGLRAGLAIQEHRAAQTRRDGLLAGQARAKAEGLDLIDATGAWGGAPVGAVTRDQAEIEAARADGTLRGAVNSAGEFVYAVVADGDSAGITRARRRPDDAQDRAAAGSFRAEACAVIAGRRPNVTDATRRLAAAVIDRQTPYGEALRLAYTWMAAAGVGPDRPDPAAFRDAVKTSGEPALISHLAYVMALAYDELRAREQGREWDARDVAHLERLITDARYVPTAWEQIRLDEARTKGTPR